MLRLVESSGPGDVERDTAVRLLAERAVLTRAICRELEEASGKFAGRRPSIALTLLLQWIWQNFPECVRVEPHPSDGIDRMIVPDGCEALSRGDSRRCPRRGGPLHALHGGYCDPTAG